MERDGRYGKRTGDNLGNGIKKVEDNEIDSIIVQRRSIRSNKLLRKGHIIKFEDLDFQDLVQKDR